MNIADKQNRWQFIQENLKLQNFWISHANGVAAMLFAFTGGLVYWVGNRLFEATRLSCDTRLLALAFGTSSLALLVILAWVIRPRLAKASTSVVYFGGIATSYHNVSDYRKAVAELSGDQLQEELVDQAYYNAGVSTEKYKWLSRAGALLVVNIFLAFVLVGRLTVMTQHNSEKKHHIERRSDCQMAIQYINGYPVQIPIGHCH